MADLELAAFGLEASDFDFDMAINKEDPMNAQIVIKHDVGSTVTMTFAQLMEMTSIAASHLADMMKYK